MLDKKLKESADIFIQATKKDPSLMQEYREMLYNMQTFAVAIAYTGAALVLQKITDTVTPEEAQAYVNKQVSDVEEYVVKYIESENIEHSVALLALARVLVRLIPSQSLEMIRYMYDELNKQ
ncbi:MAG: hypothetical protein QW046_05035 [Candidatus Micrarchaeaceae archaeon]